jgi:hypothetical protein
MRRTLLGILASSLAITGFVPAAHAQSGDSVTGQAQVQGSPPRPFVFNFSFDAHSGPSGEQPSGTVNGAPVTCLNVSGNQATIGAAIPGSAALFFVEDNNGAGQDRLAVAPFLPAPVTVCPDPTLISTIPLIQITSGDITVVDAPPLPTSKEQCKNGGWRNFGVFKNQGDCVSFVATGGKNPPGP